MTTVVLLATLLVATTPERPDLSGRVCDASDKPALGAHVFIYTAGARVGINPFCPSCYADCAKSSKTDENGDFLIRALDPSLIFRLLVVGEGFEPTFVDKVDPFNGPITVGIKKIDPKRLQPQHFVRGRVVDPDGRPVVGAEVFPYAFKTKENWGFKTGVFDPVSVTNLAGDFLLTSRSPIEHVDLKIEARGFAGKIIAELTPSTADTAVTLGRGVSVAGRIVLKGKPVPGVGVGLVQVDRTVGGRPETRTHYIGHMEIATDDTGRFLFSNVSPNDELYVYGLMNSLKPYGSVPVHRLKTGDDGTLIDVGELVVEEGHRLSGRVVLGDGKPVPPHTRILVAREQAWDSQMDELDDKGRFEVQGLPTECYLVGSIIKGYVLSPKNECASPLNPGQLEGRIDLDVSDLTVLYEPGDRRPFKPPNYNDPVFRETIQAFRARREQLIKGVSPSSDR
jgi:hypothetical protein